MTFERNCAIAIAMCSDWLKIARRFLNQWEAKAKPTAPCTRDFSRTLRSLLGILIGSSQPRSQGLPSSLPWGGRKKEGKKRDPGNEVASHCLLLLWLVRVITLVFVFLHSFENRLGDRRRSLCHCLFFQLWIDLVLSALLLLPAATTRKEYKVCLCVKTVFCFALWPPVWHLSPEINVATVYAFSIL